MPPKRIAFLVFPRLTMLDFIGAYDALRRVAAMSIDKEVTHRVIGTEAEIVDETGLRITPDSVYEDLSRFDLLYVAGGLGTVTLMDNKRAIDYLKTWGDERPLASFSILTPLPGTKLHRERRHEITNHDPELFDVFHAVLPTRMPLEEFYERFAWLYLTPDRDDAAYRDLMTRACAGRIATGFTMREDPGPLLRPFGAPGRWLSSPRGKMLLGVTGITCLVGAVGLVALDWLGWTW